MKAPILEELLKYNEENNLLLSMPGNKGGIGFLRDEFGKRFAEKMGYLDITEVEPLDNLHCPEGIIKEAQELLAETYNVKKGYFLVNGSSSGNLSAIFSAFKEGDEVLIERNCHKSIYNGAILRKLKVIYIEPVIDNENGLFLPPDEINIYKAIKACDNTKGIILTYPNYFGVTYDIEDILKNMKLKGIKTIIDCAHGAHFGFESRLPKSIVSIADYVVLSAHKTLPALTQGAYLLVNNDDNMVEFYLKCFMTTSPSYLIMASLDYARYYLNNYAQQDYGHLIDTAEKWKEKINKLGKVNIVGKEHINKEKYDVDLSRYIMILPKGYSGHKLLEYLRRIKIQAEMSFSRGIVLILSTFNKEEDFEKIYNAVLSLKIEDIAAEIEGTYYAEIPMKKFEPFEVFEAEGYFVDIEKCEGQVAKEAIIPYPPGIPIVCPGEIISKNALRIIKDYIANKKSILGIENNKAYVVKFE